MRNKKTIKEFRAFYIMASSVYAKSSRKRKWGVIVQCNKKHGRPSSEHPWEVIIPRITVMPGWILLNSIIVITAGLLWTAKLYVMIKE